VSAAGYFAARRDGVLVGEATLRMKNATQGNLTLDGMDWTLTGDPSTKRFHGTASSSVVDLTIVTRSLLKGTVDGATLELARSVLRPIPAAEMQQSDPEPTGKMKDVMAATPDYLSEVGDPSAFWYAFGPVFYRGRLDGSARVLGIASDPGPSECLPFARRTLIGDSGQKTQGFLTKLGLTRSYVLVNAFAVALRPSHVTQGLNVLRTNPQSGQPDMRCTTASSPVVRFKPSSHSAKSRIWRTTCGRTRIRRSRPCRVSSSRTPLQSIGRRAAMTRHSMTGTRRSPN